MILYHGTNVTFETVLLSECKPYKDFGLGFYLTPGKRDAQTRAINKCNKELSGTPIVMTFFIDETKFKELTIKQFDDVSEEWMDFILANRNRRNKDNHKYDVVIGPIADDGVILSLQLYEQGIITSQS